MNKDQEGINITCPVHPNEQMVMCVNSECKNSLICKQCNSSDNDSCAKQDHALQSVKDFHTKFFQKQPAIYDFKRIKQLIESTHDSNTPELHSNFRNYREKSIKMVNSTLVEMNERIFTRVREFRDKILRRTEEISKEYYTAEGRVDFTNTDIPENFTIEETKKLFEKALKDPNKQNSFSEMENIISLVKKYSDNEKTASNFRDMETILYAKSLGDKVGNTAKMIDEKFGLFETNFKDNVTGSSKDLIPGKTNSVVVYSSIDKFESSPLDLKFKSDITDKGQKAYTIDSVFCAFISVEGECLVVWANPSYVIEVYDLKKESVIKTLKGHNQHVYIVRHFFDKRNSTDYLLSTSYDKTMRIWNVQEKFSLVIQITTGHSGYYLYSGLLLFDTAQYNESLVDPNNITEVTKLLESSYAISSVPNEQMKIFNFKGKHIRDIGNKTDYTYYITSYYDRKKDALFIINANSSDVKFIDYKTGATSKSFKDDVTTWHMSAFMIEIEENIFLIESDGNGWLRIWNYQTVTLHKKFQASGCNIRGILMWNNSYVIAASSDKSFKVFEIESGKIVLSNSGHENVLCCVQKILHPKYGESLITAAIDGKIKLWTIQGSSN